MSEKVGNVEVLVGGSAEDASNSSAGGDTGSWHQAKLTLHVCYHVLAN